MPYLQLDIPRSYPPEIKCALAGELGTIYAMVMETKAEKVVVSVRELSEGSMWRCGNPCVSASVLKCDIRRGRPPSYVPDWQSALLTRARNNSASKPSI